MQDRYESKCGLSIVRVTIQAEEYQDSGVGIVIARHPFTLLVPSHLIELVEQGESHEIRVNGVSHEMAEILPAPALQRDYLSVLRFSRRCSQDLLSAHLPKRDLALLPGQPVTLQRLSASTSTSGKVIDIREQGNGSSIITDIEVSPGDSGSPLLVAGKVAAICQGMIQRDGAGTAVAVPLTQHGLSELRAISHRRRTTAIGILMSVFLAVLLSFVGFALYSASSFSLASVEVPEDGNTVTAINAQQLTLNRSWTRSFDSPIRQALALASKTGGDLDRVAIGTECGDDIGGAFTLLDSEGHPLWSYSVPDGECIYSTGFEAYNDFVIGRIYTADLDQDGSTELLVAFMHDHFFPCKLVVFSMQGDILAELWHPGYIRTLVAGKVGGSDDVIVVVSASNNHLSTEWWHPQTLFAFRGLDISGQAPPYSGTSGNLSALAPSHELWTWVIVNVDPSLVRAKCSVINLVDVNGDGLNEIQAVLSDGQFYNLDEFGNVLSVELGDRYHRLFPDDPPPPPLVELWDYIEKTRAVDEPPVAAP